MLRPLKSKEVLTILESKWFTRKRQTWSHIILRKNDKIVVVPFHWSKDIPIPTLKSIIKQSWLVEQNFFK